MTIFNAQDSKLLLQEVSTLVMKVLKNKKKGRGEIKL
jgi:hypothetical protein